MALRVTIPVSEGEMGVDIDGERLVIGRGRGADVRIPDPSVSVRHLIVEKRGSSYVLRAEPGTNGCVLEGGLQLSGGAEHALNGDCWIAIGRVWTHLAVSKDAAPPHAKMSRQIAEQLMAYTLFARGEDITPRLVVVSGKNTGDELLLADPATLWRVGRSDECDLMLKDVNVSRVHASFVADDGEFLVVDEGGKQGVYLQGQPLEPGERAPLRHGAVVRLANVELLYVDPISRALEELENAGDLRVDPSQLPPPPARPPSPAPASTSNALAPAVSNSPAPRTTSRFGVEDLVIGALALALLVASGIGLRALWVH